MEKRERVKAHNRRHTADRERRLSYMRAYRAANRKRLREKARAYYAANRKRRLAYMKRYNRRWHAANHKRRLAYMQRYRAANREHINALARAHHAANRKRRLAYMRAYYTAHRERDKLNKIFKKSKVIHSVGPDTSVAECVRLMTASKIGALIVMDGERLIGIFTERDALNKVLAGGLDPDNTQVSKVMTKRPYSVHPTTTVGDAMKVINKRRFRHLPIVDHGKVLAVVSSGDLIHWVV